MNPEQKKILKKWFDAGLCVMCGKNKRRLESLYCGKCAIFSNALLRKMETK